MDKLDLLIGIALAQFRKSGLFTPAGCRDDVRQGIFAANQLLREQREKRGTMGEPELRLDLNDLDISVAAQTVGVFLQPEWSALTGVDINLQHDDVNVAAGTGISLSYFVPAGQTFYFCMVTSFILGRTAPDGDKPQICRIWVNNLTTFTTLVTAGGNGGVNLSFTKPFAFPEGHNFFCSLYNMTDHVCNLGFTVHGYLL